MIFKNLDFKGVNKYLFIYIIVYFMYIIVVDQKIQITTTPIYPVRFVDEESKLCKIISLQKVRKRNKILYKLIRMACATHTQYGIIGQYFLSIKYLLQAVDKKLAGLMKTIHAQKV